MPELFYMKHRPSQLKMISNLQTRISGCWRRLILFTIASLISPFLTIVYPQEADNGKIYFENRVALIISSFNIVTPKPHYLNEELGIKDAVFHDLYSYIVSGHVTNTGQQVIVNKPVIFNSVKKTNRYYKQLLKKKQITEEDAIKKVNHLLDVAISVYTQSTTAFEDELRQAKKQDEIVRIFESVVLR